MFEFVRIIVTRGVPHACVRHKGVLKWRSFHFSVQSICDAAVFAVDADAQ